METKSFVKILRKVIREEVRSAVKEILGEQKTPSNKVIDHGLSLHKMVEQRSQPIKKKKFSKNSILNDILNDTAVDYNASEFNGTPDYPTMDEQVYTSDQAPNFKSMMTSTTEGINGEPVDTSKPEIQAVNKAVNRDYSQLMKAMEEKRPTK